MAYHQQVDEIDINGKMVTRTEVNGAQSQNDLNANATEVARVMTNNAASGHTVTKRSQRQD